MKTELFTQEVKAARERIATLQQRANAAFADQPEVLLEALEELRTALEELKVAEEELRQQNNELAMARLAAETERQRYLDLFQFAPDGYVVTDADGTILEANHAAAQLFHTAAKFLVGKPLVLFISPSETQVFYAELKRLCQDKKIQEWTVCLQPRDGDKSPPVYVALSVTPVRDQGGKLTTVRWLLRNVTERRQAEERIQRLNTELEHRVQERTLRLKAANQEKDLLLARERAARQETEVAERRLAFLAEASSVLAASLDYEVTLANLARLAVPHLADWCAVHMLEDDGSVRPLAVTYVDPARVDDAWELCRRFPVDPTAREGIARTLRTGQPQLFPEITDSLLAALARDEEHLRILRELGLRSGMQVPLVARGRTLGALTFVTTESGRRYGHADLTLAEELARRAAVAIENARLYQELKEADRRKDEFLAMLSHELRNPLAPILTALHILRERPTDRSTLEWSQTVIQRQVGQMTRMVDDLLDVSRITRGKIELRLEWVNVATLVTRAIETTRGLVEGRGHQLSLALPREPLWLRADPTRLEQVLCNLLNNAAKYTEVGGQIWLEAAREGDEAVLRIRDTGIGMAPELLKRVFDLFVQADRSLDRSQGGLGIGLTLVRSLVEMHGGTVRASSAGPGRGSEFVVRLPGARDAAENEPEASAPEANGRAARVLVVDDNVDAARSLAILLRLWGHEVTLAPDGPTALAAAAENRPDIVLLDIGLPGMDGYQVAQQLRQIPGMENALLIAMTGYGQEQDRRLSRDAGFDQHLVKPVDLEALQNLLAGLGTPVPS